MATSVVKLYHGTNAHPWMLTANKFFVIDDIVSYLSTYSESCITLNNFQYQKCALELAIVCDLSQHNSEPLYSNGIKYVSIQNSDAGKIYYYYVKKAEWRAKQSVKLYLVMDVANTFRSGTDFDFTERTKITREHKDRVAPYISRFSVAYVSWVDNSVVVNRVYSGFMHDVETGLILLDNINFKYTGSSVVVYCKDPLRDIDDIKSFIERIGTKLIGFYDINDNHLINANTLYNISEKVVRKIDYQSEGLSPILYKKEEHLIKRSSLLDVDWYLLYRNQNEPTEALTNPVECYLIPSNETTINIGSITTGGRINANNLELNKFYYIPLSYHQTEVLTLNTGIVLDVGNGDDIQRSWIALRRISDDKIEVYDIRYLTLGVYFIFTTYICDFFNISNLPCKYITTQEFKNWTSQEFRDWSNFQEWTAAGVSPRTLDAIDKLDRTDAKNIKLIKLPYVPYDFQVLDNKVVITGTDFDFVELTQTSGAIIYVLKLRNLNVKFNYDFNIGSSPLSDILIEPPVITKTSIRYDYLESKIYHSDYYQPKFVYDSFGYVFQLERFDIYSIENIPVMNNMLVKYVVSTTITSKFMFQFIDYKSVMGKEDYNNVMPVARNNEMVLYNVPYINYIRTGYNYDVKNKNLQAASTWTSVGLGAVSTAAALMFPSVVLKVAGVVASLISTAISVKNAVVNQVQAERNLDQKMLEAKNQSTSVSGADDVDLMSVYTENRAKMCTYECSDIMKELLLDLFFYTGYVSNRMGLPNTHTRLNFDYLEADIIITDHTNMSEEIMNELVGLYKNGLTFIHKVEGRTDMWDLEQKYENIELFMLE